MFYQSTDRRSLFFALPLIVISCGPFRTVADQTVCADRCWQIRACELELECPDDGCRVKTMIRDVDVDACTDTCTEQMHGEYEARERSAYSECGDHHRSCGYIRCYARRYGQETQSCEQGVEAVIVSTEQLNDCFVD